MTDERAALTELALDLRWAWDHGMDELWSELDAELWNRTHNPWVVLQSVASARLAEVLARPAERRRVAKMLERRHRYLESPDWFQHAFARSPLSRVAYFSMEFGLSEALPIYSGGLGIVAGDQLKTASDLGVPLIGVGLLYQQGYFRQTLDARGPSSEFYPFNDPDQLPIAPLRDRRRRVGARPARVAGRPSGCASGRCRSAAARSICSTATTSLNAPADRGITGELYGGGAELRLQQELVLGIGGWRLLRTLGLDPEVCHLNEGHAAFAVLERARGVHGGPRPVASTWRLRATRAGNLFTTHTPVEAGFDRFAPALVEQYLRELRRGRLGIGLEQLLALGRRNPADAGEPFNMAYLALRGSGAVNGVSRLHGEVSRRIFQPLFPRWPESRCRSATSPTACTCRPGIRPKPTAVDVGLRRGALARRRSDELEAGLRRRRRRRPVAHPQRSAARRWCEYVRARLRASCAPAGRWRRRGRALRSITRPRRADARASRAASRPTSGPTCCCTTRSAGAAARATASGRCSSSSPARPTRPRRRADADARVDRIPRARRRARPRGVPRGLRHARWPSTWCRASTSGSTRRAGPGRRAGPAA